MANREHIRILKQGVDAWNQWRSTNPGIQPNLRGRSFKGQDLSGADFSGADIHGADFSKVMLRGANFSLAKAGLQKRWAIGLLLFSWVLAGVAGFFSVFTGYLVALIFSSKLDDVIAGLVALIFTIFLLTLMMRKGTSAFAFAFAGAFAVVFAIAIAVAVAFAFAGAGAGAVAGAVAVAVAGAVVGAVVFAFTSAVAGAIAGVVAVAVAVVVAVAVAGAFAFTFAFTDAIAGVVAVAVAVAVAVVSTYIGWHALEGDPRDVWIRSIAIGFAAIGGTSFRDANLSYATFTQATLKSTDLRGATLSLTNWHRTKKLDRARVGGTVLLNSKVRELAVTHRGAGQSYKGCDLQELNLTGADLSDTDLTEADISNATLEGAWLEGANLTKIQALGTNFHQAQLTGACLEDWGINSDTQLEGAICEYVYLLNGQKERRPNSGNFEPGEFAKLFEEVLDTIDLIFRNGVDWKAFVTSFKQVQVENEGTELTIQSIENKGDGVVVVRVNAPPDANKEKIHDDFNRNYEAEVAALKAQYQVQLQAKEDQIIIYRQQNADMMEITKLLATRPIPIKHQTFNAPVGSVDNQGTQHNVAGMVEGDQIGTQHNYSPEQQSLAEAAAEIRQLLQQLEASNPAATELEQQTFVNLGISPTLKERFFNALQAGWKESIAQFIESKYARVAIALLEGWQSTDPKS